MAVKKGANFLNNAADTTVTTVAATKKHAPVIGTACQVLLQKFPKVHFLRNWTNLE